MNDQEWLAERFEANRAHMRGVAYRMLGSLSEADDAVQETWLRFNRAGASGIENLGGWLTTVVARVCLDMLRSRKSRGEQPLDGPMPDPIVSREDGADPTAVVVGATKLVTGAQAVAETFAGRARIARLALIDGAPGAVWAQGGRPRVVFAFTITGRKIVAIDLIADPDHVGRLDLEI